MMGLCRKRRNLFWCESKKSIFSSLSLENYLWSRRAWRVNFWGPPGALNNQGLNSLFPQLQDISQNDYSYRCFATFSLPNFRRSINAFLPSMRDRRRAVFIGKCMSINGNGLRASLDAFLSPLSLLCKRRTPRASSDVMNHRDIFKKILLFARFFFLGLRSSTLYI